MFKTKYRIVRDSYNGYEVQHKYWWLPFWIQSDFTNTHTSVEAAERWAERYHNKLVKNLGSF